MDRDKPSEFNKMFPDFVSKESKNHIMQHLTIGCCEMPQGQINIYTSVLKLPTTSFILFLNFGLIAR